jgi:hypothetical protein
MTERATDVMNELAELTAELNRHDLALGELAQAEQDKIREAREARARVEEFWENAGRGDAVNEAELAKLAAACNRAESAIRTRKEYGTEVEEHVGIRAKMASVKRASSRLGRSTSS